MHHQALRLTMTIPAEVTSEAIESPSPVAFQVTDDAKLREMAHAHIERLNARLAVVEKDRDALTRYANQLLERAEAAEAALAAAGIAKSATTRSSGLAKAVNRGVKSSGSNPKGDAIRDQIFGGK